MTGYPDLWLIRHGQTQWNLERRFQGSKDSPLTELGIQQARDVQVLLGQANLPKDCKAWVSPMGRTVATAGYALDGHFDNWTLDARLQEINVGSAEGLLAEEAFEKIPVLQEFPGFFGWQFEVPDGETYQDFRGRAESWLNELDGPAVVVTHGVTSAMIRSIVLGIAREDLDTLPGGQGVIHVVKNGVADMIGPLASDNISG